MIRQLALICLFFSHSAAQADRTIAIAMPSNAIKLELTNPSTVTVNYGVKCFSATGTEIINLTSQTLAPNASNKHTAGLVDQGTCAAGYTSAQVGTDRFGKKVYSCTGSGVSYASAGNVCGIGQTFCFPYGSSGCGFSFFGQNVWLKNEGTIEKLSGCSYVSVPGGDYIFGSASCSSFSMRRSSAEPNTHWGLEHDTTATNRGAVCCEDSTAAGLCKVTITSASPNATLASPQFKGGAPF